MGAEKSDAKIETRAGLAKKMGHGELEQGGDLMSAEQSVRRGFGR